MASLGFFDVSGTCRSQPFTASPGPVPAGKFFQVPNATAEACKQCVRLEANCDGLLPPGRDECRRLLDSVVVVQTTQPILTSWVGTPQIPDGSPLAPALAACASLCAEARYDDGYDRPHSR
jgi:hypothetical protein